MGKGVKEMDEIKNFEKKLERLREVVKKMENGNLPLDDSLKLFEEGISLYRSCSSMIENAEQRINILIKDKDDSYEEVPFVNYKGDKNEI